MDDPIRDLPLMEGEGGEAGYTGVPALDYWRMMYQHGKLTIEDHRALYERVAAAYPDQNYYNVRLVLDFIRWADPERVLELGGWDGALAHRVFQSRAGDGIRLWENHEIVGVPQVCDDIRYRRVVDTEHFLWQYDGIASDAFIASHVLEHLTGDDLMDLIEKLRSSGVDFVYVDVPLGVEGYDWKGTTTTHALTWSISEFDQEWHDAGYVIVRKARRTGSVPSFVRFYGR